MYTVLEKDLRTEEIVTSATFTSLSDAEDWVEEMSSILVEDRAYKIVEE